MIATSLLWWPLMLFVGIKAYHELRKPVAAQSPAVALAA
jgi:hypothetical protein